MVQMMAVMITFCFFFFFFSSRRRHTRLVSDWSSACALPIYITKAWSKGVAIFFAVGAVSGTVLSFELGLLWPTIMQHAGAIIGMPFSWEGTAFFVEAIALGIFLYGWNRLSKWMHWISGIIVGISGV